LFHRVIITGEKRIEINNNLLPDPYPKHSYR
jgi:hypothetical protein